MTNTHSVQLLKELYIYKNIGFDYLPQINTNTQPIAEDNSWEELQNKTTSCHLCNLSKSRKNVVFGEGNQNADLMFVGEAPGMMEDEEARPFVGRSGQLLDKIIQNVLGLKREDVYIANILKCRPPNNATPNQSEVDCCKDYILTQIKLVNPKVIVALGATSFKHLTNNYDINISRIRGEVLTLGSAKLIPTYHPSYLLRNPSEKKVVFNYMLKVKSILGL